MKKLTIEELFKDYKDKNPHQEFDFGEDVCRERIWSMTDEEYNEEVIRLRLEQLENDPSSAIPWKDIKRKIKGDL